MQHTEKLAPGSLIGVIGWWFVVVKTVSDEKGMRFCCICDNANNAYVWDASEVDAAVPLKDVGRWGWETKELPEPYASRDFPYDVIVEVLTGNHDDRWGNG